MFSADETDLYREYLKGCATAVERQFQESVADLRSRLVEEVRAAQSRHAAQAAAPPCEEPGQFTPDVLRVLHAAFDASDSVSRAERRELAGATGLTERQILTWFANQRQRRSKKRAVPYDVQHRRAPSTPHSQRSSRQQHHPQQQCTVSASTSASSLVEYDDAAVDIPVSSSPPRAPLAPPPAFEWQLPVPPSLAQFTQQQQPLVLPSLQLSAPTPIAASFAPPAPAPAPAYNPFDSSSSPGGWSPSSSTSSLSFGAPSAAAPSVDFFAPGSSLSSSPPSSLGTNPFVAPLAPVEAQPVVGVPGMGDAWMDETFYENLFASLGLDGSSAGVAAPQQLDLSGAGLDLGGMIGADGDGLTLSLEAVRAEEGMGGEMRFAF